jgi:hypothetical protein
VRRASRVTFRVRTAPRVTYQPHLTPEDLWEWANASDEAHIGLSEEDKELRLPGETDQELWIRLWSGGPWGGPDNR